jgi:hypothetical protein
MVEEIVVVLEDDVLSRLGMFRMDLYALFLDYNGGVRMVENKNIHDAPL